MKKFLLIVACITMGYALSAQIQHGIKVGLNFAKVGGNIPDGSNVSALKCPAFSYILKFQGDKFAYFMELGYSQSGFMEKVGSDEFSFKMHNMDYFPVGLQYAFLSDWSKIRPVLQTSLGLRLSPTTKARLNGGSWETADEVDQFGDILWSIGGGVTFTKHAVFLLNYGGGFANAYIAESGWRHRQIQLSATYFF